VAQDIRDAELQLQPLRAPVLQGLSVVVMVVEFTGDHGRDVGAGEATRVVGCFKVAATKAVIGPTP
jgi:hypothetical protein